MRFMTIGRTHRGKRLRGLGVWWTFTAGLVLVAAVIVAIVQNSRHVGLHYLAWRLNVSLIVVILATALIAILLDEAGGLVWRHRRRSRLARQHELGEFRGLRRLADPAAPAAGPRSPRLEASSESQRPAGPDI